MTIYFTQKEVIRKIPSVPGKDNFVGKALDDLRELGKYSPPPTITPGSGRKQQVWNLSSTWLYSIVFSDGKEVTHTMFLEVAILLRFTFRLTLEL